MFSVILEEALRGFILAGSLGLPIGCNVSLGVEKAGSLEGALHLVSVSMVTGFSSLEIQAES